MRSTSGGTSGPETWPHGLVISSYHAEPWREAVVVYGVEEGEDLADEGLRPANPPPLLAQEVEPVVPPLRAFAAPSAKSARPQKPDRIPLRVALLPLAA